MSIRLVVFDLGGVMIRIRHAWSEILAEMDLRLPDGFTSDRLSDHRALSAYQNGQIGEEEFLEALAQEFGIGVDQVREAHQLILREDYPGAAELVKDLRNAGIKVACLSNTNELHYREFFSGRFPVCEAFDELLASHRLGLSKPDPAIYKFVEERYGLQGDEIFFFDDNAANIEAAKARNWSGMLIDPEGEPPAVIRQELVRRSVLEH
jgi:epoxide hydrolase-like predicted phosphatase